jgi:hypothetical protein
MPGTFKLTGMASGLESGQKFIGPNTMEGGATIGQISDATLATGDNLFPVPTGSVAVAVFLPFTATATVNLRTNLNPLDAGVPINASGPWFVFPLATGTTEIILNVSSGGAVVELTFI